MKAWLSRAPGPPAALEFADVAEPEPGPGQLRLRVVACGVNYPDVLVIEDRYQIRPPRPFAPGAEIAGVVEKTGAGVTGFAPGDQVMAICNWGGLAEQLLVPAERAVPVPAGLALEVAASVQLTYGTAWHGLVDCAGLASGETLLVLGAAGGVGLAAVEIGRLRGARVVAAVSSEAKAAAAREAGAEVTVVYDSGVADVAASRRLAERFKEVCGTGAHVVLDPVGGGYAEPALRAIRPRGRYAIAGFTAGIPQFAGNLILLKDARLMGVPWGAVVATDLPAYRATLQALLHEIAAGRLRPRISLRVPLSKAPAALEALRTRAAIGKVVVTRD